MGKSKIKKVAVIMGSRSDLPVMKKAMSLLDELKVPYDAIVVSAHRTPQWMFDFSEKSELNYSAIIAGAGGAAHLPGMVASLTTLPVVGVPIKTRSLAGLDSLLSIVQMPKGVPVMTMAINGAENAALAVCRILSLQENKIRQALKKRIARTMRKVLKDKKIKT